MADAILSEVAAMVAALGPEDRSSARAFQHAVASALERWGWSVRFEVPTPFSKRIGRIDLLAKRHGVTLAIECDRVTPRAKSIEKLSHWSGYRVVLLREVSRATEIRQSDDTWIIGEHVPAAACA